MSNSNSGLWSLLTTEYRLLNTDYSLLSTVNRPLFCERMLDAGGKNKFKYKCQTQIQTYSLY